MKTTSILILALLAGACATPPTLEELEFEALRTGDWSAVERRERAMARRAAREPVSCPEGQIQFCETRVGDRSCQCVGRRDIDMLFGWN